MSASEAVVNWDSGHLSLPEVLAAIQSFVNAADGEVLGMDVVGDWSPIHLHGLPRRLMHWTEHPPLAVDPDEATRRNEAMNMRLLDCLSSIRLAA